MRLVFSLSERCKIKQEEDMGKPSGEVNAPQKTERSPLHPYVHLTLTRGHLHSLVTGVSGFFGGAFPSLPHQQQIKSNTPKVKWQLFVAFRTAALTWPRDSKAQEGKGPALSAGLSCLQSAIAPLPESSSVLALALKTDSCRGSGCRAASCHPQEIHQALLGAGQRPGPRVLEEMS